MNLKEKELWLELYKVAEKIQKLEPWKYLWDVDLLVYICKEMDEIFYCSVMGHGDALSQSQFIRENKSLDF